jgi:hypothetical protein
MNMKMTLRQLRWLIREELAGDVVGDWRDPNSGDDSFELNQLIINRWGGAGINSDPNDDEALVSYVEGSFPEIREISQRELPTHLFRGIQLSPEDAERVLEGGLPPRGVLTSWSSDRSVAEGFANPMGGRIGLLLTIQRVMAREHVVVGLNTYFRELASRSGEQVDDYMMGEEEFLLKDFEIPRRNIRFL